MSTLDDPGDGTAALDKVEMTMRMVWAAMIFGVMSMAGVGYVLRGRAAPPPNATELAMILTVVGVAMVAPAFALRVLRERAFAGAANAAAGLARYQQLGIAALAMGEAPGLIGGVSLFLGLPIYVAAVLIPASIASMMINIPSPRAAVEQARWRT